MTTGNQSSETSDMNESLQKVAKGALIVFIGTILGILLGFVGRVLIARNFTQAEYGIFSIGFTILAICGSIGSLGLVDGIPRQIAYYLGRKEIEKVRNVMLFSLLFGLLAGVILFLLIFFSSQIISVAFFRLPELSYTLKVFSIAVPFLIFIHVLKSIFRGFYNSKEKVIFEDILKNLLFVLIVSVVIWLGYSFKWAIIAFTCSVVITCVFFIFYFVIKKPISLFKKAKDKIDFSVGKELLCFSLPLLLLAVLYQIMTWTDTLMLGYFRSAETVGLYNAAYPLGRFISTALLSMIFIYMPIVSTLHAKNKKYEMRRSYVILTKWLCGATFPLAAIFVFFPNVVLHVLFGQEYILAGVALQIFAIGLFVRNLMGPNGATLTAIGQIKFLMYATFAATCINVLLNVLLIPRNDVFGGVNGAALASVIALVSISLLRSIKLYYISKIHSLDKNILKPTFLSIVLVLIIYLAVKEFLTITFWMLPVFSVLFLIIYVASLFITKSFDKEDMDMLLSIEKRTGVNLTKVKRLIKKFI